MAKKTNPQKRKNRAAKKRIANGKASPSGLRVSFQTIKVHPHFAKAIASVKQFAPEEIEEIKKLASSEFAGLAQSTGCWLSDSGGPQHCVNLPPEVCARKGGISVPTKCPNT